ncbi:PREDICTED: charged multivesicular body protein 4b-like [Amphimedon queenslandica]|uniref:Charged multivesicular body protein 4b n=1 Tax=Amphimedon queenslandica TaxID=400682 RepID=A0A1X7VXP7_AMPQE|nr:PREDICTED: charged multivesicular body protein 4b-like [Amphimedon queenslandica]|eukprot:XP_003382530.1 PREDICTED: charged multivesicular body protein 4b-like [Amphimedon queenslandica]
MEALARMFGAKKGEPPTPQMAIQKLRETEEMLNKKSEFLEKKIDQENALIKKHGLKNKRGALNALKRKKRLEKQLQQIDGTLSTIEFQRESLENAQTNTEVLKNMSYAAKALKAAHANLDVDDVHDMMDDIEEQNVIAQEISDALSTPFGMNQELDDDELLAELEEMEQAELDEQLLDTNTPVNLELPTIPDVPNSTIKSKEKDDESDLRELAEWLN